ncbi:uncharacterized protein DUF4253 [Motilibacter rhizosphaerae]|uniref:Uncharacterized protein DUF4253 n=1 Tax=Motilibacter rhizosphaerae TaxID=598652 RepID=A0A4Q7N7N0_9ACTN|nr:DUF4253 domain-containing protein [Motilibacter rhizosphaerae]RZS77549.1 uncharacterized protein DUF4253 [Motilibacter rhizosphaerae]
MVQERAEVAAALNGTVLERCAVAETPAGLLLVKGIQPDQVLTSWRAARSVVPQTGRWPVAVMLEDLRIWDLRPRREDVEELKRLSAVEGDPWDSVWQHADDSEVDEADLSWRLPKPGGADLVERARRELVLPTIPALLDRWVYEVVLSDPSLLARASASAASYASTEQWFEPTDEVCLALLPTPDQWLAPAWLHYGEGFDDGVLQARTHRDWAERWGAELVASWGTMRQFLVARRPSVGEEAWTVAGQLLAAGPSLQVDQWELALALTQGDAWFLHDRP